MKLETAVWVDAEDMFRYACGAHYNLRKWFLLRYAKSARIQSFVQSAFWELGAVPVIDFLTAFAIDAVRNKKRTEIVESLKRIMETFHDGKDSLSEDEVSTQCMFPNTMSFPVANQDVKLEAKSNIISLRGFASSLRLKGESNIVILSGDEQDLDARQEAFSNLIICMGHQNDIKCNDCIVILVGHSNTVTGANNTVISLGDSSTINADSNCEVFLDGDSNRLNLTGGKVAFYMTQTIYLQKDGKDLLGRVRDTDDKLIQLDTDYRCEYATSNIVEI